MSQIPKSFEECCAEMDDDNESFHSFIQSEENSEDLDDLSNLDDDDDDTITDEHNMLEMDLESSSSFPSEDPVLSENNANIANFTEVPRNTMKQPMEYQLPKRHTLVDHHLVPKPRCDSPMPSLEAFKMDIPNKRNENQPPPTNEKEKEAMQKYAFTEIWVERQQSRNRSLHRQFTTALENYFGKEDNKEEKLTEEEQQKGAINKQLFVDPAKFTAAAASTSFQTVSEAQTYVSPFEDMPPVPKEEKLPGQKPHITVPAGYDVTNLVQYKDPNHWHRRSTTRYDSRP